MMSPENNSKTENTYTVSLASLAPLIEKTVSAGGKAEITVVGHSMDPLFLDRKSRVRLIAPGVLRRGDLAFFQRDSGAYVLHRIVKIEPDGTYTFCGDAQTALERGIRKDQIFAKVEAFARREKWTDCGNILYKVWWNLRVLDRPLRSLFTRVVRHVKRHLGKG